MNQEELTELIEVYGRDIYSFCLSLTGNKADADDLYQESFLTVIRKMPSIILETNPKSYMLTVVVHRWKDKKRKYARRQRLVPMESLDKLEEYRGSCGTVDGVHPSGREVIQVSEAGVSDLLVSVQPEKVLIVQEMHQEIRRMVSELEDKLRIPVYLYYMEELPVAEISRILHIPGGTVKSRLHRARMIMKKRMVELGYEI